MRRSAASSVTPVGRPARYHPFSRLASDRGEAVVVSVVVQHGQGIPLRGGGHDQIRDGHRSVLRSTGEKSLDLNGSPGDLVGHGEVFEGFALGTEVVMLWAVARAVEDLQINDRTGPDEAAVDVRADGGPDDRCNR